MVGTGNNEQSRPAYIPLDPGEALVHSEMPCIKEDVGLKMSSWSLLPRRSRRRKLGGGKIDDVRRSLQRYRIQMLAVLAIRSTLEIYLYKPRLALRDTSGASAPGWRSIQPRKMRVKRHIDQHFECSHALVSVMYVAHEMIVQVDHEAGLSRLLNIGTAMAHFFALVESLTDQWHD